MKADFKASIIVAKVDKVGGCREQGGLNFLQMIPRTNEIVSLKRNYWKW